MQTYASAFLAITLSIVLAVFAADTNQKVLGDALVQETQAYTLRDMKNVIDQLRSDKNEPFPVTKEEKALIISKLDQRLEDFLARPGMTLDSVIPSDAFNTSISKSNTRFGMALPSDYQPDPSLSSEEEYRRATSIVTARFNEFMKSANQSSLVSEDDLERKRELDRLTEGTTIYWESKEKDNSEDILLHELIPGDG